MAYNRVFIPDTIKSAFRARGIWLFNRNAVSSVVLTPAEATSMLADGPVPMPTVVRNTVHAFISLHPIKAPNYGEASNTSTSILPHNVDIAHTSGNPFIPQPYNQSPNDPVAVEWPLMSPASDLTLRCASAICNARSSISKIAPTSKDVIMGRPQSKPLRTGGVRYNCNSGY